MPLVGAGHGVAPVLRDLKRRIERPTRHSIPNSSSNSKNHCIAPVASIPTTTRLRKEESNSHASQNAPDSIRVVGRAP